MKKIIILILFILLAILIYVGSDIEQFEEEKYTAIIVEPRKHAALEMVLQNFTSILDSRWEFIIFHGTKNEEYVKKIVNEKLGDNKNRIKYVNLGVENLTIADYNALFFDKHKLYDHIHTEMFLAFQTDTLLSEKYKEYIYDFMKYDYVGAPWDYNTAPFNINGHVGNGGLSLRKKSKMLEIIEKCPDTRKAEDVYFAFGCDGAPVNKPSFDDALNFSVETALNPNNKSFGIHKPWDKFDDNQLKSLSEYIPQVYELKQKQNSE